MSMFSEKPGKLNMTLRNRNIILPNFITIMGLLCGVYSIMLSVGSRIVDGDNFVYAAYFLLLAAFFDGIDGKVARIVNGTSDFGVQLDSLCDMVSFGVAPAILVYEWLLKGFDRVGIVAVFLFVACGALRLARFNVQSGKISNVYFVGLPIPAAAAFIATSVLFIHKLGLDLEKAALSMFFLVSIYLLAFLMVSTVPFFSFKKMSYFKARPFQALIIMVIFISILVLYFEVVSFIMITVYITIGLLLALFKMIKGKPKTAEENNQQEN